MNENEPSDEVLTDDQLRFVAESAASIGGMNTRPMGVGILSLLDRLKAVEAERDRLTDRLKDQVDRGELEASRLVCDMAEAEVRELHLLRVEDHQEHKRKVERLVRSYELKVQDFAAETLARSKAETALTESEGERESLSMSLSYERAGNRFCRVCTDHSREQLDYSAALAAARGEGGREALLAAADDLGLGPYTAKGDHPTTARWLRDRAEALGGGE